MKDRAIKAFEKYAIRLPKRAYVDRNMIFEGIDDYIDIE